MATLRSWEPSESRSGVGVWGLEGLEGVSTSSTPLTPSLGTPFFFFLFMSFFFPSSFRSFLLSHFLLLFPAEFLFQYLTAMLPLAVWLCPLLNCQNQSGVLTLWTMLLFYQPVRRLACRQTVDLTTRRDWHSAAAYRPCPRWACSHTELLHDVTAGSCRWRSHRERQEEECWRVFWQSLGRVSCTFGQEVMLLSSSSTHSRGSTSNFPSPALLFSDRPTETGGKLYD